MDVVQKVAEAVCDIPGDPSSWEIARVAIEAYQDAIWPVYHFSKLSMLPELRQIKAQQLTAHILHVIGPFLCEHGDSRAYEDASRALQQLFYESGADIVTDTDRRVAGLPERGPSGLTAQELSVLESRRLEAMMQPLAPMILAR